MDEQAEKPGNATGELRSIEGGRRTFSFGDVAGSAIGGGVLALGVIAVGCLVLGGVWCLEQLWGLVA